MKAKATQPRIIRNGGRCFVQNPGSAPSYCVMVMSAGASRVTF